MNPVIAFTTGLVAAFTPCVIVLFPLVLYRFFQDEKKQYEQYLLFIFGFLFSYMIFAYSLSGIFTSLIRNGFKFGLGLLFVVLAVLALWGKLNPLNFPAIKNSFVLGALFAIIVSFSPCALPFLGVIVSLNTQGLIILNLLFFGLGLLSPSILFAIFGRSFIGMVQKKGKLLHHIDNLMSIILLISGVYLMLTIKSLQRYDIYIIAIFLLSIYLIILRSFFIIYRKKDIFSIENILLLTGLLLLVGSAIFHCDAVIEDEVNKELVSDLAEGNMLVEDSVEEGCQAGDVGDCEVCQRCLFIFIVAAASGLIGIFLKSRFMKKV